jgi:hypothetical protein
LLGAGIGKLSTWRTWLVVLKAAFGLKLTSNELVTFYEIAGGREPPRQRVRELWVAAGRRSGKSRVAGALATYFALIAGGRNIWLSPKKASSWCWHLVVTRPSLCIATPKASSTPHLCSRTRCCQRPLTR